MRWRGQNAAIVVNECAMTTFLMPPVDPDMSRHSLQITDLPVQWISAHGDEKFGSRVHEK